MRNKIKGIIFYIKEIKDNDLFIKILSSNNEVDNGMVYGGNSSKKKMIYQKGYFIDYIINKKNENAPNIINAEISKPFLGNLIEDKYKLFALLSIISLINLSILEGQKIENLYQTIEKLIIKITENKKWITFYFEWLFMLLKLIGYEIDYKVNANKRYYDLNNQIFLYNKSKNSIEFPHNVFSDSKNLTFKNINSIFLIFESIYSKNHLENINYIMPLNYLNFKRIILNELK